MRSLRAFVLFALVAGLADARAQDKKKVDPKAAAKAAEVEKVLLAVPDDVTQADWLKSWREKLVMTYSEEMSVIAGRISHGDIVKFSLENKTPCTIKVRSDLSDKNYAERLVGLGIEGQPTKRPDPKTKDADEKPKSETWTVEPGKKLALSRKPKLANRVMVVPLKNDLDKKSLVSAVSTSSLCTLEIVPTDKDAKPLELIVVVKVGSAGLKVVTSGYYLSKPDGVKDLVDKILKFN